jgi:C4-dicarboxylate transporter, DctM subunit
LGRPGARPIWPVEFLLDAMTEALVGLAVMLAISFMRVPIAISMGLVGFLGLWWMRGLHPSMASATTVVYESGFQYTLSVVPLFILMGNFVTRAGMSRELYRAGHTFVGHLRGGLAMATVLACGGFGAICGSSIATAATMTKVAYPSMADHHYSDELAVGTIAAGGTLGILIPPSTIMVIYGIMTNTSIAKLFAAGILPGIVAVALLCLAVQYICWRNPAAGPSAERASWRERFDAFKGVWAVVALFVIVMGGIYGGVFTATEGAGIGAFGAFCFALARRALSPRALLDVLVESSRTTAMLFMILVGALIFANFINYTTMPADLKAFVSTYQIHPMTVIVAICVIYVVLGTAMEELSMILLTVPVFFPLVVGLGFDPVWFGILIVVVVQIGLISPPVGMNMFVVKSMLPRIATSTIFRGVTPFVVVEVVLLAVLVAFPSISLVLPRLMNL